MDPPSPKPTSRAQKQSDTTPGVQLFMPVDTAQAYFTKAPPSPLIYPSTPLYAASPHYFRPTTPVTGYVLASPDWRAPYLRVSDSMCGYLSPANTPPVPSDKNGDLVDQAQTSRPTDSTTMSGLTDETTVFNGFPTLDQRSARAWYSAHQSMDPYNSAKRVDDTAQRIVMRAKNITEQLIMESNVDTAVEVLKTSLQLLGHDLEPSVHDKKGDSHAEGAAISGVKLVHPDEFKNPSTFLKIYGDPLCFSKLGPLPKKDRNGNWECHECHNVNFPRRFRCNMCNKTRDANGDQLVSEYAIQVYERYLLLFKQQIGTTDPIVNSPEGMQVHLQGRRRNNHGRPRTVSMNATDMSEGRGSNRRRNKRKSDDKRLYAMHEEQNTTHLKGVTQSSLY